MPASDDDDGVYIYDTSTHVVQPQFDIDDTGMAVSRKLLRPPLKRGTKGLVEAELYKNGFEDVLWYDDPDSGHKKCLLTRAGELMKCEQHKQLDSPLKFDEMLAVLLYTGSRVCGDMRDHENKGDYKKWRVVAATLEDALHYLGTAQNDYFLYTKKLVDCPMDRPCARAGCPHIDRRTAEYHQELYHGTHQVKHGVEARRDASGTEFYRFSGTKYLHPATFMSTSSDRRVSEEDFAKRNGSMLILDATLHDGKEAPGGLFPHGVNAADVSWISKFQGEREILFGRRNLFLSVHAAPATSRPRKRQRVQQAGRMQYVRVAVVHPDEMDRTTWAIKNAHLT